MKTLRIPSLLLFVVLLCALFNGFGLQSGTDAEANAQTVLAAAQPEGGSAAADQAPEEEPAPPADTAAGGNTAYSYFDRLYLCSGSPV